MYARKQQGMTAIGWIIILAIVGVFATASMKIFPIYLEHYKINSILKGLQAEMGTDKATRTDIRDYLIKRFDVESIRSIKYRDVEVKTQGDNWAVRVTFDSRTSFIGNLDFIVTMDKTVEIPR